MIALIMIMNIMADHVNDNALLITFSLRPFALANSNFHALVIHFKRTFQLTHSHMCARAHDAIELNTYNSACANNNKEVIEHVRSD